MPKIGVDLTAVGLLPDGVYTGVVQTLAYQIKIGDKWNKEGTQVVDFDAFSSVAPERRRLHYTISIPGKGNIFSDYYMMESALGFIQAFMKACGVAYDKDGFDPEEAQGKQVQVEVTTKEDEYGVKNNFKFTKI